jgi:phospholipid/cholesterol/gamma-HCH transport system substrate-binding protein
MQRGKKINNVAIGIFIFAGLFLLLFFIYFAGKFSFVLGGGYKLSIEYDFLDNLQLGAKVKISGGPSIGYINNLDFKDGKIIVQVLIDGKYKINRDAVFNIYSTSLVGQKYINVSGYNPSITNNYYTNNETIEGITPIGFARAIELLGAGVKNLMGQNNTDMATKLKNVFANTADLIEGLNHMVNDNSKDIRQSISAFSKTMNSTGDMMAKVNNTLGNIEAISKKLNSTVNSLDVDQLKSIVSNVNDITYQLKTISADLNQLSHDENTPLGMIRDSNVRTRLDNIIKNFEGFSEKIKNNPNALIWGNNNDKKK